MQILTGSSDMLTHLTHEDAIREIQNGNVKLDPDFIELLDEKELAITHAIKMCHVNNPIMRSSSLGVQMYLKSKLLEINIE
jgi:hypothetical protein